MDREFGASSGLAQSGAGGSGGAGQGGGSASQGAGGQGGGEAKPCTSPSDCPSSDNESATCEMGKCGVVCNEGYLDCDPGALGCETKRGAKENCAKCGDVCATSCIDGGIGAAPYCNDPIDIAAGFQHTCAIRRDGSLWCWGSNEEGELGMKNGPQMSSEPIRVDLPSKVTRVAAGGTPVNKAAHTCAILDTKQVMCWGNGQKGQLGTGAFNGSSPPTTVMNLPDAVAITAGGTHTCAINGAGDLLCWGNDSNGQLGNGGGQINVPTPMFVMAGMKSVAAGEYHTCSISDAGALFCWGEGSDGEIGVGDPSDTQVPMSVFAPLDAGVDEVAAGDRHTCARKGTQVYCFGNDYNGAVGASAAGPVLVPTLVAVPGAYQIECGRERTGAINGPMGGVKMWGLGALGNGMQGLSQTPVDAKVDNVVRIALGDAHTCALKATGEIFCWGDNQRGQLGNPMVPPSTQYDPVAVSFPP